MPQTRRDFLSSLAIVCAYPSLGRAEEPMVVGDLVRTVVQSQRAGFEGNDWERYLEPWSEDAVWVMQRREDETEHAVAIDRKVATQRIELLQNITMSDATISHHVVQPRMAADRSTGTVRMRTTYKNERYGQTVEEVYRLRATKGKWKIVQNVYWPINLHLGDQTTPVNAQYLASIDKVVEKARLEGDLAYASALCKAMRWAEAYEACVRGTQNTPSSAGLWARRAYAGYTVGEVSDAVSSAKTARSLDPAAGLPRWTAGIR